MRDRQAIADRVEIEALRGELAWIVEKFREWTDSAEVPEDAVDRDQLLTNVILYWLTATAGSSAQLYVETAELLPIAPGAAASAFPGHLPLGVAVFPHDILLPPSALRRPELPKDRAVGLFHGGEVTAPVELGPD